MNIEIVRMNLVGMEPGQRRRLAEYCNKRILSTLLPPPPTDEELANARTILALIEDIERRRR